MEKIGFFVLVDAGENDVHQIRKELLKIDEIKLAHCLIGPTDLICYGEAKNFAALKDIVAKRTSGLIEAKLNPISHTETCISLTAQGKGLDASVNGDPSGKAAAWIFADINMSGQINISEKLLETHPEIIAVHTVMGSKDTLFYVEADTQQRLMQVIDDGIRVLRTRDEKGQMIKTLSSTDTRLVLMD